MKWEKTTLKKVTEYITDGDHQPAPKADKGISFIKIKDIDNNRISFSNSLFVPQEYYDKLPQNRKAVYGDVLYTVVGSYGIPVLVDFRKDFCFERNIALLHPNNTIEPSFLYYSMKNPVFFEQANNIANGSAQKLIPLSKLASMEISIPPLETQRRIASILSAYDDLIENNQKQIKLLEEAAQRLYKEWFVDLHFPGYENIKVVDGVPEGWKKEKLEDVITYEIGGGWGEEEKTSDSENEAFVIRGTDFYGLTHGELLSIPFRYHKASNLSSRKLQHGDIIFEVSGGSKTEGVARTALITQSMLDNWNNSVMCASFCKLVRTDIMYSQFMFNHFIYLRQSGKTSEYDKKSASSIVNYRWKDFLSQELVLLPSNSILDKYNALAESAYSKIVACSLQIEKAKQARDRLLPKLMCGEIEV